MTARPCGFKSHLPHYAVIAQLGERVLDVDEVAGSSPAGRIFKDPRRFKETLSLRGFCCYEKVARRAIMIVKEPLGSRS